MYSARSVRDGTKVALKVFKRGPNYDGAVQREQFILDAYQNPKHNIGTYCTSISYFAYYISFVYICNVIVLHCNR